MIKGKRQVETTVTDPKFKKLFKSASELGSKL